MNQSIWYFIFDFFVKNDLSVKFLYLKELIKSLICSKGRDNNLHGTSWLIPLLFNREPQVY